MDRFFLLIPALILLATLVIAFVVYAARCAMGRSPVLGEVKHNLVFGPFLARFLVWLIGPIERLLIGRVSPNAITAASLALCAIAGIAVGSGRLASAVWLFAVAGILDVLDGRLARTVHHDSQAGALFDSVSDRWGELFVFSGYLWFLHDSAWLVAVLVALGGSMMVSYTRARAEALGVRLSMGVMQRAERIVVITGGTLVAACFGIGDAGAIAPILGVTMLVCGVASTATAINRFFVAYRVLAARKAEPLVVLPVPRPPVLSTPTPARAVRSVTVTQASR